MAGIRKPRNRSAASRFRVVGMSTCHDHFGPARFSLFRRNLAGYGVPWYANRRDDPKEAGSAEHLSSCNRFHGASRFTVGSPTSLLLSDPFLGGISGSFRRSSDFYVQNTGFFLTMYLAPPSDLHYRQWLLAGYSLQAGATQTMTAAVNHRNIVLLFVFLPIIGFLTAVTVGWVMGGISTLDLCICGGMYLLTAIGITAGFHRFFVHKSFQTSNFGKWILGALGSMAGQGPLFYWASSHRI